MGSKIMVAPLAEKGKRLRQVVFPEGKWIGDDGVIVDGPVSLTIEVPLERLPWFRKVN